MSAPMAKNTSGDIPHRTISEDVLNALDPFYRAGAEVLIERGVWELDDGTKEANR